MQLEKILKIRHEAPDLKAIVQMEGKPSKPGVISVSAIVNCDLFVLVAAHRIGHANGSASRYVDL